MVHRRPLIGGTNRLKISLYMKAMTQWDILLVDHLRRGRGVLRVEFLCRKMAFARLSFCKFGFGLYRPFSCLTRDLQHLLHRSVQSGRVCKWVAAGTSSSF